MSEPLAITAELGGTEQKFCLSPLGFYRAVNLHGHDAGSLDPEQLTEEEIEKKIEEAKSAPVPVGSVTSGMLEELWMARLHYDADVSFDDFLASLPYNFTALWDLWGKLKRVQVGEPEPSKGGKSGKKK